MFQKPSQVPGMQRSNSSSSKSNLKASIDSVFGNISFRKKREPSVTPLSPPVIVASGTTIPPRESSLQLKIVTDQSINPTSSQPFSHLQQSEVLRPTYPKFVNVNTTRKASIASSSSNTSYGSSHQHHHNQHFFGRTPTSPEAIRHHERQHEMWEIYCEWLQGLQSGASSPSFSDYEYIRSRNRERQRKLSAAMPPASANSDDSNHRNYFPIKQSSNSIRSSATSATNTTFAIPQSPSMSPDRRSSKSAKSPRVVSFGGSSVRSFDSAESPTSVRMNTALHSLDFRNYQKEGESSSFVSSNATTQDSTAVLPVRHHHRSQSLPNSLSPSTISSLNAATPTTNTKPKIVLDVTALLPLPPHHATTLTSPTLQREESLVIKPSNDFITALLAYKSHLAAAENKYRRSMSPTRVTGTGVASPIRSISPTRINSSSLTVSASAASSSTSAQITVLDPSVQIEWESALRMRVPTSDWSKLIQEVLENSISVGSQHRTYHEAKLYWDIIWRTLPLGCTLESEHRPFTPSVTTPSISSPACCPRCQNGFVETFVHFLWTCPVAIVLWRRLEWVLGSLAEGEARKARAVSLRKYGGGTRRDSELWDYGFNTEGQGNGRVSISLVDVLFCFPKVRKPNLADGSGTESPPPGPSDRYLKTVIALHATALMSLLEMRAYPGEDESLVWSFFVARYEARREVEFEQRTVSLN